MRESEKSKRNLIIIGLCAVVAVMIVGFAAFSQQLQISSTSEVTSNWSVKITKIETIIPSGSSATDNSSICDESGTPKQCGDGLTASVSATLVSPGDSITYRIRISNKGNLNAVLNHINLNANQSNDIGYYINKDKNNTTISDSGYRLLEENGVLNAMGDSNNLDKGYVYLTIYYKDYEGQTSPVGDNKTVTATATFDFVQTSNEASSSGEGALYYLYSGLYTIGDTLDTTDLVPNVMPTQSESVTFLRIEVDNDDTITDIDVCANFTITDEIICLESGPDNFNGNKQIIDSIYEVPVEDENIWWSHTNDFYSLSVNNAMYFFDAKSDGDVDIQEGYYFSGTCSYTESIQEGGCFNG